MKKNRQDRNKIYHFRVLTVKAKHRTICELKLYLGKIREKEKVYPIEYVHKLYTTLQL